MSTHKRTEPLETFEACLKRHRAQVKGVTKSARTDTLVAKQLARADQQRGHCRPPLQNR